MPADNPADENEIRRKASSFDSVESRDAFLAEACGEDVELAERLKRELDAAPDRAKPTAIARSRDVAACCTARERLR